MIFETPVALLLLPLALIAAWSGWRLGGRYLSTTRGRALALAWGGAVLTAVLAAAGPSVGDDRGPDDVGVILVDVSESRAGRAPGPASRVDASDRRVSGRLQFGRFPTTAPRIDEGQASATDLEAALRAAATILDETPPGARRRVWLSSDGAQTAGDALAAVPLLNDRRIQVDVQPDPLASDPAVVSVVAAPGVRLGGSVRVRARIAASDDSAVRLVLLDSGGPGTRAPDAGGPDPLGRGVLAETSVSLTPGEQDVTLAWKPDEVGTRKLVVKLEIADATPDARTDNNEHALTVDVLPAPRTLLVSSQPAPVARALDSAGIKARRVLPTQLAAALPGSDLVVIDGVPAEALGTATIGELSRWVRSGGGLVALAGQGGLATGSSPEAQALRRTLPLASVEEEKVEPPPLALVFILDKSDSMARERKWEVAARTTATAHSELHPESQVGLITFSDYSHWIVRPTPVKDLTDFEDRIRAIQLSGGTDMFPALGHAYEALGPLDARLKHVVLLSDGVSLSKLHRNRLLLRKLQRAKVTVSTVAMGSEADTETMAEIARETGGRYWYVEDPEELPRIFAEETRRTTREPHIPDPRVAHRAKRVAPLAHLNPEGTKWKPTTRARTRATAEVLWRVDVPDPLTEGMPHRPLLARARFGRGRAVALAAGADASRLPAGALVRGMVAAALEQGGDPEALLIHASLAGDRTRVEVQRAEPGALPGSLGLQIEGGETHALQPIAVDRAVLEIPASSELRLARVVTADGTVVGRVHLRGAGRGEILPAPAGTRLLESLAAATGGDVLAAGSVPEWLQADDPQPTPLRVPLGLLALILSTLSVLARRPVPVPGG